MYEATQLPLPDPVQESCADIERQITQKVSNNESATHPRPIVARSNEERRGTKPRNLYAVNVYNRRNGERRKTH